MTLNWIRKIYIYLATTEPSEKKYTLNFGHLNFTQLKEQKVLLLMSH